MIKHTVSLFLSFFLFFSAITFSTSVEARRTKRPSHAKVLKHKHASKKVSKLKKHSMSKKQLIAKKKKKNSKSRKIASLGPKKFQKAKFKRRKSNLPKEYGRI